MCELFGFCSKKKKDISRELKVFYSHSSRHPHGWGMAYEEAGEMRMKKEPVQASESPYLTRLLTEPFNARLALAHIRYATIGQVEYKNCHPYIQTDNSGRSWTLIHNGTIFDFPPLNRYFNIQSGNTDSERILLYFIDRINQAAQRASRELNDRERFELLDSLVAEMAKGNKLNLIFYDGDLMYVHTNYADTLHCLEEDGGIYFSTQALDGRNWQKVPFTVLQAYRNGKLLFRGTEHGNEYRDKEEDTKFLYQIFSDL